MTLERVCEEIATACLDIHDGETVLLIRAIETEASFHRVLRATLEHHGGTMLILGLPSMERSAAVPAAVTAAMEASQAVLLSTPWIFPHAARRRATAAGARVLSLCTVTDDMLLRAAAVDHRGLAAHTAQIARRVGRASVWRVTTPAGTDLTALIAGRRVVVLNGLAREAGSASGLPAGVIAVTPAPGTASGGIVIDGSIDGYGLVRDSPSVVIERDAVIDISGGEAGRFLRERFESVDASDRCLCEVGTGTNPRACYIGNLVEDERVRGSAHVGFGGNLHLGGERTSALHFDATMRRPSIFLDGEPLVVDGVPVVPWP